jgi:hypothetical protein
VLKGIASIAGFIEINYQGPGTAKEESLYIVASFYHVKTNNIQS